MDLNTQINLMLTTEQLHTFHNQGYLRIPGILPLTLLNKLQQLFVELMVPDDPTEKVVHENKGEKYIVNLENICSRGNLAVLELLGYPPILEIAEQICGKDFFQIQEFAVIKNLGDELPVYWHQDMIHERSGHCFTMGIYLDNADKGDGALRVVPRSHTSHKPICELRKEPAVEVAMKAGDILIHDMMLAHCSLPLKKNSLRRVIYFEFLSATQVAAENIYTKDLVDRRTRLLFAATRLNQSLHPAEKKFVFQQANPCTDDDTKDIKEILQEIYSQAIHARPSAYCFEDDPIFSTS